MFKHISRIKIWISLLILVLMLTVTSSKMIAQRDTITEMEEKLMDISDEERIILESLFIQAQQIEELEREKDKLTEKIEVMKEEIANIETLIEQETNNYEGKLNILKQVLRSYQRMGPSSYIEIILDADSVTNLLRRINTLRDLTRNTGELLESIDGIKNNLLVKKNNLHKKLLLLEKTENDLEITMNKEEQKIKELERQLASLKGDREYYQEKLNSVMSMMDKLSILITDMTREFSNIIEEGNLPESAVRYELTSEGIKVSIEEDILNKVINHNPNLPDIILHFYPQRVKMELPEMDLVLNGSFVILDQQTLRFEVKEGSLYGMLLNNETIQEFFKEGDFILNLKPLILKNILKNVETFEGYMELTVQINLN